MYKLKNKYDLWYNAGKEFPSIICNKKANIHDPNNHQKLGKIAFIFFLSDDKGGSLVKKIVSIDQRLGREEHCMMPKLRPYPDPINHTNTAWQQKVVLFSQSC